MRHEHRRGDADVHADEQQLGQVEADAARVGGDGAHPIGIDEPEEEEATGEEDLPEDRRHVQRVVAAEHHTHLSSFEAGEEVVSGRAAEPRAHPPSTRDMRPVRPDPAGDVRPVRPDPYGDGVLRERALRIMYSRWLSHTSLKSYLESGLTM